MDDILTIRWWNLSQTFPSVSAANECSKWPVPSSSAKAASWDADGPAVTLTDSSPSKALESFGLLPIGQTLMPLCSFSQCDDWLGTDTGKDLLGIAQNVSEVVLAPAVWTRQTDEICRDLRRAGVEARDEVGVPHGRIFHWNTRVGMRDLFLSIPELSPFVVQSLICHDADQVRAAMGRLPSSEVVAKSNFALGGLGTVHLRPGEQFEANLLADEHSIVRQQGGGKDKSFSWAFHDEPFVLEKFVGNGLTNLSITVDAQVDRDRRTAIIGLSEQLLIGGVSYAGISSAGASIEAARPKVHGAIESLGLALGQRGYQGFFNVDFVITEAGHLFLCDLNVRRSAPLDVHMLVRKVQARMSDCHLVYWQSDCVSTTAPTDDALIERLDRAHLLFDSTQGAIPLAAPILNRDRKKMTVSLLVVGIGDNTLRGLIDDIQRVCVGA